MGPAFAAAEIKMGHPVRSVAHVPGTGMPDDGILRRNPVQKADLIRARDTSHWNWVRPGDLE